MQAIAIVVLISFGAILGGIAVWYPYRHRPTNAQLDFANAIYKHKSDDYKALCKDALQQAEMVGLIAQSIHASNPSEASAKILEAIDRFILLLKERASAKQFTPIGDVAFR